MKLIQYKIGLLSLATFVSASVMAQDLHKSIVIDKDIVPELKDVERINVTPQVPPLKVQTTKLNYDDKAKTATVLSSISIFEPVANVDTMALSKYRGYAALGYFPTYNLGLSAGYRVVDKENVQLNAWMQYDGTMYNAKQNDGTKLSFNDHELSLNAQYAQRIKVSSLLGAKVGYTFNSFSCPWIKDYTQNVNRLNFDADWKSSFEGLKYQIEVGYDYFAYGKDAIYDGDFDQMESVASYKPFEAVKEHAGYVNAGASMEIDDDKQVALDFGAKMIHDNHLSNSYVIYGNAKKEIGYETKRPYNHAILTLIPHYDFKYKNLTARVGVQLDYQIDIKNEFNIAPDVYVDWNLYSIFSAYAHFTGGVHQNSMSSIFDVSHYFVPSMAYGNSKLPYVIDAGVNVGPFKNATLEVFGGYARANDWYMPCLDNGIHRMESVDIDGWHVGVAASYNYKDIAKVRASYELAPQSYDDGYYIWRDRAKYVVKASATVTPIEALDITLDYEYRGRRCAYEKLYELNIEEGEPVVAIVNQRKSLGHVSNLSLGGLYRYTDQISFFARLENILDCNYDMLYDIPAQGFTGLVGVTYKF